MDLQIGNVTLIDSNALANEIMLEIQNVEQAEKFLELELSSEELFRIDCAILSALNKTKDFSRDLLEQMEDGLYTDILMKPPRFQETVLKQVQEKAINDMTLPIACMFDEMEDFVIAAFK